MMCSRLIYILIRRSGRFQPRAPFERAPSANQSTSVAVLPSFFGLPESTKIFLAILELKQGINDFGHDLRLDFNCILAVFGMNFADFIKEHKTRPFVHGLFVIAD